MARSPLLKILRKYEKLRPFTDDEAWSLFRLAAIGEAVGWTMLGSAVLYVKYFSPNNDFTVQIAGRVHGMFFLLYILAVVVLYPSQRWSYRKTVVAAIASVPPYGSLVFEQWASYRRGRAGLDVSWYLHAYRFLLEKSLTSDYANA